VRPLTTANSQVRAANSADDGAVDPASYAKAILNILDDFGEERERQSESQRAVLNILEDIDGERRKVEQVNADLQVVNEAMRRFTAVAAHDLRSPIASILGFATLLTANWATFGEEDRRRFVGIIDGQCRNLSRLVDDLFTLSSIEGGSRNTQPELIVLAEAIDRCLDVGGGDTASVSVSCSPDLVVWVDPHHLGRILDNYLQKRPQVRPAARADRGDSGGRLGRGPVSRSWTGGAAGVRAQAVRQVRPSRHPEHEG